MNGMRLEQGTNRHTAERSRFFGFHSIEPILATLTISLGLTHTWIGRYSINPDGISYLDVGDSLTRGDWFNAVNAYWSPLYGWLLGIVNAVVRPSPRWEFPLAHLVNFGIFLLALLAFRYLLRAVLDFRNAHVEAGITDSSATVALPDWVFVLLGYAIFLWAALELETIYDLSPDLAAMACLCFAAGVLLRFELSPAPGKFALFGLVLGIGYWIKAPLFPIAFVFLICSYLWKRSLPQWRRGLLLATAVFLCTSAPLLILLSQQKHRFTFGDSGRLNYAWFVSPATPWRNWHGEPVGSGQPLHPTRELLRNPPVFSFDGPVIGTYPPWTDPSYWNEGLKWHVDLKSQARIFVTNLSTELQLLLRAQPGLLVGLLALALLTGAPWIAQARRLWPLFAVCAAGFALYLPVHVEERFTGGFVIILFLALLATMRLRPANRRSAEKIAIAVFAVMILGTADLTIRHATKRFSIPGVGPNSAIEDVAAAEQISRMGAHPGEKIAIIGMGRGVYCARLAKLRIVAEVLAVEHGYERFWELPDSMKSQVYDTLANAHVEMLLTACPSQFPQGWQRVGSTPYCELPISAR